jgi:hypothetical protein
MTGPAELGGVHMLQLEHSGGMTMGQNFVAWNLLVPGTPIRPSCNSAKLMCQRDHNVCMCVHR